MSMLEKCLTPPTLLERRCFNSCVTALLIWWRAGGPKKGSCPRTFKGLKLRPLRARIVVFRNLHSQKETRAMTAPPQIVLVCSICHQPVAIETSKTDEHGHAIHEDCYVLKLRLFQESKLHRES
jgi:hypothetical protein